MLKVDSNVEVTCLALANAHTCVGCTKEEAVADDADDPVAAVVVPEEGTSW